MTKPSTLTLNAVTGIPEAPRIALLEPPYAEDIAADLASMMPPGMEPLKLFRTLAHNPRILRKIRAGNLLDRGSIDRRDRELVILRTTARCGSEYEWGVHAIFFAERFEIGGEQLDGSRLWSHDDPRLPARDAALWRLVDELHEDASVSPPCWEALSSHFEPAQIVELVVLTGFYHTISFVTNAFGVELEEGARRFPG